MNQDDCTLSSPFDSRVHADQPLLCISILWHPELERVGEQIISSTATLEISRYLPIFHRPHQAEGLGLGQNSISREPLRLLRDIEQGVQIWPPNSRMVVELNGQAIQTPTLVSNAQLENGVILGLGRAVLLCLHFLHELPKNNPLPGVIGIGACAQRLREAIFRVAKTDANVLLLGETGTGKEVAARAIHAASLRAEAGLVTVNMAALNEALAAADLFGAAKGAYTGAQQTRTGLFAQAQDATLFLDEIGNAPVSIQPMLLRVLEGGDYRPLGSNVDLHANARIIAATDQNLYKEGFNQALLRRLESFVIQLVPLRKRREDIGVLIRHTMQNSKLPEAKSLSLPYSLVLQMALYDWPGNIRQLTHIVNRALLALRSAQIPDWSELAGRIEGDKPVVATLASPKEMPRSKPATLSSEQVLRAMRENQWQISAAAQSLGIARQSMYTLLENHPHIRRAEQIGADEIRTALAENNGDIVRCAGQLQTPSEGLRRYAKGLGLMNN